MGLGHQTPLLSLQPLLDVRKSDRYHKKRNQISMMSGRLATKLNVRIENSLRLEIRRLKNLLSFAVHPCNAKNMDLSKHY